MSGRALTQEWQGTVLSANCIIAERDLADGEFLFAVGAMGASAAMFVRAEVECFFCPAGRARDSDIADLRTLMADAEAAEDGCGSQQDDGKDVAIHD